jgi:hypothetical protein
MVRFRRKLPRDAALKLAHLANVKDLGIEYFCDAISEIINEIWQKDWRAVASRRSARLVAAAKAALTLNKAACNLKQEDRKWLLQILKNGTLASRITMIDGSTGQAIPTKQLVELSTWAIASDLSTAAGILGPPPFPGEASHRPGFRRIKDTSLELVVWRLRSFATSCGGSFTFSKRNESGTLVQALEVLRPHLPDRVVPNSLPFSTIERIIVASNKAYARLPRL